MKKPIKKPKRKIFINKHGGTLYPYPKGVSGNPAGKPKGTKSRKTIIKEYLELIVRAKDVTGTMTTMSMKEKLILRKIKLANSGNNTAINDLLEMAEGPSEFEKTLLKILTGPKGPT